MDTKKDVVAEKAAEVKAEAPAKKPVAKRAVAKKAEKPVAEKAAEVKTEKVEKVEKAEKPAAKKVAAKKAEKPAAEKKAAGRKAAVKSEITVQFHEKEFSQDDLVKIAKDVWVYDLGQKAEDFKSVAIYVKPEEDMAYFVVNGETSGSFGL